MKIRQHSASVLVAAVSLLAFAAAQDEIQQSFNNIRRTLERGILLQINIEVQQCTVTGPGPVEQNLYISMPMRQWQHETMVDDEGNPAGQTIRAEDWYLNSGPPVIAYTTRVVRINDDDTVSLTLSYGGGGQDPGVFEFLCELGDSAVVHGFGDDETNVDNFYTYLELKSALLLGRHVESIVNVHRCLNADEYFPPGMEYVSGYRIENLAVLNDATPDEFLTFYDYGIVSQNGSLDSFGQTVEVYRNGSVTIRTNLYESSSWTPLFGSEFHCIIADSVQFFSYRREEDATHITYDQIKEATLQGHDVELIVFTEFCDVKSGPEIPRSIGMRRFDQYQLFRAGGPWGPLEYLAFSSYTLNDAGILVQDIVRVYEDDKLTIGYGIFNPGTGDLSTGELQCDLGVSSLFHTVTRNRRPETNYNNIVENIIENGAIYEIEVDFSGCDTGDFDLASIYGGILWETYINDARGQEGFLYGVSFALVNSPFGGAAWDAAAFTVLPDRSVFVEVHLYDFLTGDDLIADSPGPMLCELHQGGDGGGQGSVYFYRYP